MLSDYTVNIIYKNRALEPVKQKSYSLQDYCQEQKIKLMHTIMDVENAFYRLQNEKCKDDWDVDTMNEFQHIRHKLLDAANGIERLPKQLCYKGQNVGSVSSGEFIADIINKATGENVK